MTEMIEQPTTKMLGIFPTNMRTYVDAYKSIGVKQRYLADCAMMSRSTFNDLMSGKVNNPRLWTAVRVAEALRVDLFELVTTVQGVRERCVAEIRDGVRR